MKTWCTYTDWVLFRFLVAGPADTELDAALRFGIGYTFFKMIRRMVIVQIASDRTVGEE